MGGLCPSRADPHDKKRATANSSDCQKNNGTPKFHCLPQVIHSAVYLPTRRPAPTSGVWTPANRSCLGSSNRRQRNFLPRIRKRIARIQRRLIFLGMLQGENRFAVVRENRDGMAYFGCVESTTLPSMLPAHLPAQYKELPEFQTQADQHHSNGAPARSPKGAFEWRCCLPGR